MSLVGATLAVLLVRSSPSALIADWRRLHEKTILINARALSASYERIKASKPKDPRTGKPKVIKPNSFEVLMGVPPRGDMMRSATPALNTFSTHVRSRESALLSHIGIDEARLVVSFTDSGMFGVWKLFPVTTKKWLAPRWEDSVNAEGVNQNDLMKLANLAASSPSGTVSKTGRWHLETWHLKFSDRVCLSCHTDRKLGDTAARMVYAVAPRSR